MAGTAQPAPALEDLAAFVLVAETGSFTAAAKRLRVPKSTISRRIARLESDLDAALVVRTSRRVTLSEAGQAYLDRVGPALRSIESASHEAREDRERPRGHLRVTAPFDVATGWLAFVVPAFRAAHPEVTIEVIADDRRLDLVAEGIDLALRAAQQLEDSALVARKIATIEAGLWASPAYLKKRGHPKSVGDLAEHDVLVMRASSGRARLALTSASGAHETIELSVPITSNDPTVIRRMAMLGAGIALLPALHGESKKALEPVLPEWSLGAATLYVVYPSARALPAKVRAFRDFLLGHTEQLERCK
jgi:DNA-binding transcriptional LysR family regulator